MDFLKQHPTIGGAILSLLGAVLGIFIKNPEMVASLVAIAGVFFGLHQVVTPVTTAVTQVTQAATQAATQVAERLDEATVGTVGQVTTTAGNIINNTVDHVVGGILGEGK